MFAAIEIKISYDAMQNNLHSCSRITSLHTQLGINHSMALFKPKGSTQYTTTVAVMIWRYKEISCTSYTWLQRPFGWHD